MSDATSGTTLRRDRIVIGSALAIITAMAWAYVLWLAADMTMGGMQDSKLRMIPALAGLMVPALSPWHWYEFAWVLVMWIVMMVGMMTPSAVPMILIYARVGRAAAAQSAPFASVGWFVGGYLLVWSGFSIAATTAQWALERTALLNAEMAASSTILGAVLLIAAGVFQWSPIKDRCLKECQAPFAFIQRQGGFRRDAPGALLLGLKHGAYCLGCCWMLMALLFVGGVMNVLWIAAIAIFVLAEKVIPPRWHVSRIAGAVFVASGIWLSLRSSL